MIKYRLDCAKNYLEDAVELFNKESLNSSASSEVRGVVTYFFN